MVTLKEVVFSIKDIKMFCYNINIYAFKATIGCFRLFVYTKPYDYAFIEA